VLVYGKGVDRGKYITTIAEVFGITPAGSVSNALSTVKPMLIDADGTRPLYPRGIKRILNIIQ
jgi:hypothetical protein